ncbi:cold shock domain-containing protein [Lactobacillus sp. DCY120]|uniref:Cold shock domain-containing protein n=1 Tax=Bombilactobacillus apium TaxID=2675299 RepID=A0A850R574_9LACO|nr:cold shock domain-containing protein [Bombilactobacillus apium]NVY95685.1 cold shock domain-containing protein [Bombilactobacillus apium]
MITGTVAWFNDQKGIGELTTPEKENIFVYHTALQTTDNFRTLVAGQTVEFQIAPGYRGPQAVNVQVKDV